MDSPAGPLGSLKGLNTPWISEPLCSSPPAPSSPGVSTPFPCWNFLPTCLGLNKCSSPPPLGNCPGHRAVSMVNATKSLATEFAPVSTAHSWRAGRDHILSFCPCQARYRKHQAPLETEVWVLTVGLWEVVSKPRDKGDVWRPESEASGGPGASRFTGTVSFLCLARP